MTLALESARPQRGPGREAARERGKARAALPRKGTAGPSRGVKRQPLARREGMV
jgi:hypothetical protein